jgi:transcriptional regulator with XRE-family HTH domain
MRFLPFNYMDSRRFPNYLVSNRKRLGLSQADVAYLLGAEGGGQVCRHERFLREPSLSTALAYEAIYKRSASELFNGLYEQAEEQVAVRAKSLVDKAPGGKASPQNTQRRKILANLAGMASLKK